MVTVASSSVEQELKLEAESVQLDELEGEPLAERSFVSVYLDAADGSLRRAGITLRRRTEDGQSIWQLKLPRPDGRLELEERGGPAGPPDALDRLLRARLRGRPLATVATLKTRRRGRIVDGAEVTLDQVEVLEGAHVVARFCEIEAELADGQFESLERRLLKAGARETDGRSKLQRALDETGVASAEPKQPGSDASALDLFRSYVLAQYDRITAHDPGVRVGGDPEGIHDMRVAVRRLRSALRTVKPMVDPEWAERLRAELDWLADALAPVRDLDVFADYLRRELAILDAGDAIGGQKLLRPLDDRRESVNERLRLALDSDRYLDLLGRVEAAAEAPPIRQADISLRKRLRKEFRKLKRQVNSLGQTPSNAALHKTRIRAKRVRYAAELAVGGHTAKTKHLVNALKGLQDTLGELQDAVVAEQELRHLGHGAHPAEASLAAGRLIERQRERAATARGGFKQDWKRVRHARP